MLAAVAERRAEFEQKKHVPQDVVDLFKKAGVYRAGAPRRFGGDALPPGEFLALVERISTVDGSAGWVASFGSSLTYLAALPVETQAEIYADGPDVVFAGGLFPVQKAQQVDGGHRVTGRWKFASGCLGADWLGVGIQGGPESSGKPLTALLRPDEVTVVESWDVIGMRGTGSHDLAVDSVTVPDSHTFVRGAEPTLDEPLFRYPVLPYAAQVLAVVGLGVARAALDEATARGATAGHTGAPRPAERATFRIQLARAEAQLRAARAFFYDTTGDAWDTVLAGDPVTREQASLLRLAATHAAAAGDEATRAAFRLAGIAAIADGHPLQRHLRDAAVVPQHAFLQEGMYDAAGAVLTGLDPFPGYL
ncbi:acyl-CoA dehydrogenase family protein [Streptomyces sp. NPDC000151]|uniref:acyl-CoA dehydrogenase family protein n=1 Tax=Streptomyces sp. NPDC000151 TaxID=3154244 RepID=UPI003319D136